LIIKETKSGLGDVIVLSSSEVKCHACLDLLDTSPRCICESAKCAFRTGGFNSVEVLERFCPAEKWALELIEDGCITNAEGEYVCYCSTDFCNDDNMNAIRGNLNCTNETCPNTTMCFDTKPGLMCTCAPWDPSCDDRRTKQCSINPATGTSTCNQNCCATLNCNYGYCQNNNGLCTCVCPVSFTGPNCLTAIPLNPCSTFICQNGGTSYFTNGFCQWYL
jgi:hypothetical protein